MTTEEQIQSIQNKSIPEQADQRRAACQARVVEVVVFEHLGFEGDDLNEGYRYVYILQCSETHRIKIGIADDLARRIRQIQSTSATELEVLTYFVAHGQDAQAFENYLHRRLADSRLHGEWFGWTDDVKRVIEHMVAQERNMVEAIEAKARRFSNAN